MLEEFRMLLHHRRPRVEAVNYHVEDDAHAQRMGGAHHLLKIGTGAERRIHRVRIDVRITAQVMGQQPDGVKADILIKGQARGEALDLARKVGRIHR